MASLVLVLLCRYHSVVPHLVGERQGVLSDLVRCVGILRSTVSIVGRGALSGDMDW